MISAIAAAALICFAAAALCWRRRRRTKDDRQLASSVTSTTYPAISVMSHKDEASHRDLVKEHPADPLRFEGVRLVLDSVHVAVGTSKSTCPAGLCRNASCLTPTHTTALKSSTSRDEDDVVSSVERELSNLRASHMAASQERREARLVQHEDADSLLQAQRERLRMVRSLTGEERAFDPDSLANRALVQEQARAHSMHARLRTRERMRRASHCDGPVTEDPTVDEDRLDPITGTIKRASISGGSLHPLDLTSGVVKYSNKGVEVGEDPQQWLLQMMMMPGGRASISSETDDTTVASRLARARVAAPTTGSDRSSTPTQPAACPSTKLASGSAAAQQPGVDLPGAAPPPRSLLEIRKARRRMSAANEVYAPDHQAQPPAVCEPAPCGQLDPLTDALHTATTMGIALPPPPSIEAAQNRPHAMSCDARARLERVRRDLGARASAAGGSAERSGSAGLAPTPQTISDTLLDRGRSDEDSARLALARRA